MIGRTSIRMETPTAPSRAKGRSEANGLGKAFYPLSFLYTPVTITLPGNVSCMIITSRRSSYMIAQPIVLVSGRLWCFITGVAGILLLVRRLRIISYNRTTIITDTMLEIDLYVLVGRMIDYLQRRCHRLGLSITLWGKQLRFSKCQWDLALCRL